MDKYVVLVLHVEGEPFRVWEVFGNREDAMNEMAEHEHNFARMELAVMRPIHLSENG